MTTETCPICHGQLPQGHRKGSPCPSCTTTIAFASDTATNGNFDMDTKDVKPFDGVDADLYARIKGIGKFGSWHLAVMAEILNFHIQRLSKSLNKASVVSNRMINLSGLSKRISVLEGFFDEFISALTGLHVAFAHYFSVNLPTPSMVDLREFFDQTNASVDGLLKFHESVAKLRFVRESAEHQLQQLMMDWVHHELVCLEELRKQLNRKSNFERDQLRDRSVQVTLVPPDLQSFFRLTDSLKTIYEDLD